MDADTVCRLLPMRAAQRPLAVKGLLTPDLPLLFSRPLSAGPRCEFSLGPRALPPRGPRTPGVPLHHQLYAGRAYHPHPHLHHLLHDSCSAPGVDQQGRGEGPGPLCRGGSGGPGTVWPVNAGRGLRRTGQTAVPAQYLRGCVAFGELFYFSEPQWYICKSRGVKRRCWISGRCHPHWPGHAAPRGFVHMLGFLGRFHLSRGFHSLRMCQNHCTRQSLGSHSAFL